MMFRGSLLFSGLVAAFLSGQPEPAFCEAPPPGKPAPAAQEADLPSYIVRALRQGTEIEFLGEIDYGAAQDLRRILDANPSAKILHLNSPGGDVPEARDMFRDVRPRGLIVTVDKLCMSACTLVLLAGKERFIAPGAQIGFHRFWGIGMTAAEMDVISQADRNFMRGAGVSPAFVDKAFSTPSTSMWIPTAQELTTAGVITGITSRYLITVGLYRSLLGERVEAIRQILDGIKKRYPDRYAAVHEALYQAMLTNSGEAGAGSTLDSEYSEFLVKFMAHGSDPLAIAFVRVFVAGMAEVADRDSDSCFYMLFPSRAPASFHASGVLPHALEARISLAMLKAAADGARRDAPLPSTSDAEEDWRLLVDQMAHDHVEDLLVLTRLNSQTPDHAAACKAELHVYAAILALPLARQGPLARSIFAIQANEKNSGNDGSATTPQTDLPRLFSIHPDK